MIQSMGNWLVRISGETQYNISAPRVPYVRVPPFICTSCHMDYKPFITTVMVYITFVHSMFT